MEWYSKGRATSKSSLKVGATLIYKRPSTATKGVTYCYCF